MWVFSKYGFYSVVAASHHKKKGRPLDPEHVMIRARLDKHLDQLRSRFPVLAGYKTTRTPDNDYLFRIIVPTDTWVEVAAALAAEAAEYGNFKLEAQRYADGWDDEYQAVLGRVWWEMFQVQDKARKDA